MSSIFNLNEDSVIYVVCPANNKTGGTELLHQLVFDLNAIGRTSYIAYYMEGRSDKNNPTPNAFKDYIKHRCFIEEVKDNKNNLIVFPEVCIGKQKKFRKIQKCVWWLSVDNYKVSLGKMNRLKRYGIKSFLKHLWLNDYTNDKDVFSIHTHLYQSFFAADFLKKMGISETKMEYLSDYINDIYIKDFNKNNRKDIVIFNPKKGLEFTQKLMNAGHNITWVPIQNMTNLQVQALMESAKIYIDFGNHPGKDRIPREAAMSGCCIITNRRGSASFANDVPILEDYKYNEAEENIPVILNIIHGCIDEYEEKIVDFADYRHFISEEKEKFRRDVIHIFG